MKRSSSASRVFDRALLSSSSSSQSSVFRSSSVSSGLDSDVYLPTYNPFSHAAEKERRRLKLAKIFIHFIPVVVVFCAVVLWFFSDPGAFGRFTTLMEDEKLSLMDLANLGQLSTGGIQ